MDHLPIFLNVDGKRTLIVGKGVSAARKADLLLRAGSDLTIVTPQLGEELSQLAETYSFRHQATAVTAADLDDANVSPHGQLHQRLGFVIDKGGFTEPHAQTPTEMIRISTIAPAHTNVIMLFQYFSTH